MQKILETVKNLKPLIHAITNPISINQCANAMLAVGCRPIMAQHPKEVSEITETSAALMLNLGNITDARIKSMMISAKKAAKKDIPVLLDLVGIACSNLRRQFAYKLISTAKPAVIKGNYSEIKALYLAKYKSAGVDADTMLDKHSIEDIAAGLAKKYNTVILASGQTDIITNGSRLVRVNNGNGKLAEVTGTGCLLGALCSCFLSVCRDINTSIYACAMLGIAGEISKTDSGNGSFMIDLMDNLSVLTDFDIENRMNMEEVQIEN